MSSDWWIGAQLELFYGLARLLYQPREGENMPKPVAQPGMIVDYGSGQHVVERVRFKNRTWKRHAASYEYHVSDHEISLHESSIANSRWPDESARPDFVTGQECYIYVERGGKDAIKTVVQVQTSFSSGADVILYREDRNELYEIRKTTLEKMLEKQKDLNNTVHPAGLHIRSA